MTSESLKVNSISPAQAISVACPHRLGRCEPCEIYLLGQSILDSTQLLEGDRLYFYSSPGAKPLVAELKLADSFIPFLPEVAK